MDILCLQPGDGVRFYDWDKNELKGIIQAIYGQNIMILPDGPYRDLKTVNQTDIIETIPVALRNEAISALKREKIGLALRMLLQHKWRNLTFRRIRDINTSGSPIIRICSLDGPVIGENMENLNGMTPDEIKRKVTFFHDIIQGSTNGSLLRFETDVYAPELWFDYSNYGEMNWENSSLDLTLCPYYKYFPKPRIDGLICGVVDPTTSSFIRFFHSSEQFLILFTCVMNGTCGFKKGKSPRRLITRVKCNNYRESIHKNPNKEGTFYEVTTEKASRNYFYIYQLILTCILSPEKLDQNVVLWGKHFPGGLNGFEYLNTIFSQLLW